MQLDAKARRGTFAGMSRSLRLLFERHRPVRRWFPWALVISIGLVGGFAGCRYANRSGGTPRAIAKSFAFRADKLAAIDAAITEAIDAGKLPGGVVWLEHRPATGPPLIYHHAYGQRALTPRAEPMTEDTVFDAASLTKVMATTPAILRLVQEQRVNLDAPVAQYLPGFGANGKEAVTVRHLMTHTSGLRSGLPRDKSWSGPEAALALAAAETLQQPLGTKFVYSDINFIVLGELVRAVTGSSLADYAQEHVFGPLRMVDTGFRPAASSRIAPTERLADGTVLRGVVHDPTARRLDGVAGHAGVFTTAEDLARYARAWLDPVPPGWLEPATCAAAVAVQSPEGLPRRGLGWDIDSPYAGPRGTLFPVGSYGHTGWTGTSLWIDPFSRTFVIFLSNRNHPTEAGDVRALRRVLGTLAAETLSDFDFESVPGALPRLGQHEVLGSATEEQTAAERPAGGHPRVLNGVDVLARDGFRPLQGRKVGLVTNHTGHDRQRRPTIDLLFGAPGVKLVALFSPEHGIRGEVDELVKDGRDAKTGLPIYSLYGERRAPTPAQLAEIDILVFDIQDIGCRFYTYISTLGNCLEAAGKARVPVMVLDRPNPLGGERMAGPVLTGERSFVAWHELPIVHGLTTGELARMFNTERALKADLTVIPCEGWRRTDWFDATGLPWTNPSPNMRRLTAAVLYPGVGLLEFCHLSVGRGTDTPFEILGAPYIQDTELATYMNSVGLPGVRFVPVRFTPSSSIYRGTNCAGVQILITDRDAVRPVQLGLTLARTLHRLHPAELDADRMHRLLGHAPTLAAIKSGRPVADMVAAWEPALVEYRRRAAKVRLY